MNKLAVFITIILGLFVTGCNKPFETSFNGSIEHVHGMGYIQDDGGLYFASHTGLKIYRGGEWFEKNKNLNDYMGFNAVDKGFYTSGHPGVDSKLSNPIGLKRSYDGGKTLKDIDFEGESDFHVMAVGYKSHDIILMNETKNSKLGIGIFINVDNSGDWKELDASGLDGNVSAFSIHPTNSDYIAAATTSGIYLSSDRGATFKSLTETSELGTAVYLDEENLYYSSYDKIPKLVKYNIKNKKLVTLNLPDLINDGPILIAQNPANKQQAELAIYTKKGQAFLSKDGTKSWEEIVENGKVK